MGLTFCLIMPTPHLPTGVHDSFLTHAGSVDVMSVLLRQTFVELHSRPLLQQLQAQLQQQLDEAWAGAVKKRSYTRKNGVPSISQTGGASAAEVPHGLGPRLPPMPPTGDLNLEEVYRAEYFFS